MAQVLVCSSCLACVAGLSALAAMVKTKNKATAKASKEQAIEVDSAAQETPRSGHEAVVINVRKAELQKQSFRDFEHWQADARHVYIGRNMSFYVKGALKSKWANPYSVKKYGTEKCLAMYHKRIVEGVDEKGRLNTLLQELPEL